MRRFWALMVDQSGLMSEVSSCTILSMVLLVIVVFGFMFLPSVIVRFWLADALFLFLVAGWAYWVVVGVRRDRTYQDVEREATSRD